MTDVQMESEGCVVVAIDLLVGTIWEVLLCRDNSRRHGKNLFSNQNQQN